MAREQEGLSIALEALSERIAKATQNPSVGPEVLNALRSSRGRMREAAMWIAEADALQGLPDTATIKVYLERG